MSKFVKAPLFWILSVQTVKLSLLLRRAATDILDGTVRIESPVNTKLNMQSLRDNYTDVTRVSVGSVLSVVLWELTVSVEANRVVTVSKIE